MLRFAQIILLCLSTSFSSFAGTNCDTRTSTETTDDKANQASGRRMLADVDEDKAFIGSGIAFGVGFVALTAWLVYKKCIVPMNQAAAAHQAALADMTTEEIESNNERVLVALEIAGL